jgi:hypothetical protein
MPTRLECPRCGSPNVARLPADPVSPAPGFRCANCGVKLRDRGMLVVYLVVLVIAAGIGALNVFVQVAGGLSARGLAVLAVCVVCGGYSAAQIARPAPRRPEGGRPPEPPAPARRDAAPPGAIAPATDGRLSTAGPRADLPPSREPDQPEVPLPRPRRLRRRLAGLGALVLVGGALLLAGGLFGLAALLGGVQPVDLALFLEERQRDPYAAQIKYRGKTLELTGYVVESSGGRVTLAPVPDGTSQVTVWVSDALLQEQMRGYPARSKVRLLVKAEESPATYLELRATAVLPP